MKTGYQLAQLLKGIKTPNNNDRLARAMFLANAVAYSVPLNPALTWQDAHAEVEKDFIKVLNSVNENVTVDTKLAQGAFRQAIRARYELMMGVTDPALIQMALDSHVVEVGQTPVQQSMTDWLVSRSEFAAVQMNAVQIMQQHLAAV
jgi:hypothetical protein